MTAVTSVDSTGLPEAAVATGTLAMAANRWASVASAGRRGRRFPGGLTDALAVVDHDVAGGAGWCVTRDVTRNVVHQSVQCQPGVEAVIPLALIEAPEADVGGLPNWLRGFDSRRPLCI